MWMWHLETWVSGGLDNAGRMVGLDDLREVFTNLNGSIIV